jgi:endonuclease YncB( thermonuclease family)
LILSNTHQTFDFDGIEGEFYVESVYDGDTITLLVPIKLSVYSMNDKDKINLNSDTNPSNSVSLHKVKVRLFGIDTPEIKPSKKLPNREKHIAKAKEARDFLLNMILNKIIKVKFFTNDLYGRPLVKLYAMNVELKEICLNDLMVSKGYANKYDGGKKNEKFKDVDF